eukprot:TRINITY_DN15076_c0_g1_i1.p1 TRINITY_DN15076_c0_g1~~TRINITY_DN15076_c0_g1_i1.p1  ORF type:complete len:377 (-),score=41.47 TRINITY_DN15076_c0_g1_i1:116-1246(-)
MAKILWFPLVLVSAIHIIALAGLYLVPITATGLLTMLFMYAFSGFGITVGYHRLWSHKTYKASAPWRFFWAVGGTAALQGSIRWWSRLHRLHHSFPDTDKDPYGPNLGFWYSHMLWIFHDKDRKQALSKINIADIDADPIARWQSNNYRWLSLAVAFGVPMLLCRDFWQAYLFGGCLARVLVWHTTWFVNSLAHWLGDDEYSNETSAKDHLLTALLTLGEGNHGFHHAFPTSYKNGVRWYHYDPTKWLIDIGRACGLCYDLIHPSENEIQKARYQVQETKLSKLGSSIAWPELPAREMTLSEYQSGAIRGERWLAMDGFVYDVTNFVSKHPGGAQLMLAYCGKEPSAVKDAYTIRHTHTKAARNLMDGMAIARLEA